MGIVPGMEVSLENFYVVIGAERNNLKLDDSDKHRPENKQLFVFVGGCMCVSVGDGGAHSVLGLG